MFTNPLFSLGRIISDCAPTLYMSIAQSPLSVMLCTLSGHCILNEDQIGIFCNNVQMNTEHAGSFLSIANVVNNAQCRSHRASITKHSKGI